MLKNQVPNMTYAEYRRQRNRNYFYGLYKPTYSKDPTFKGETYCEIDLGKSTGRPALPPPQRGGGAKPPPPLCPS